MKIKTRFSPSPSGNLHIGSVRTALYSWLFSKSQNGIFLLRIEDTDIDRSSSDSLNSIVNGLKWLGLDWDEGPYFQSKRLSRYQEVIDFMLKNNIAYRCYCSIDRLKKLRIIQLSQGLKPKYDRYCRNIKIRYPNSVPYVVRFCNPITGIVSFNDDIRGIIQYHNHELDDLILQRSNGMPTYNFAVVVDDSDMEITHVIRGEDHINNTPRQINILKSLGKKIPQYAHVSMILNPLKQKLSKRDSTVSSILEYRSLGYLPEAILNYLVRLGWSYGNQEIFSLSEMRNLFTLKDVSSSSSVFDINKLLWFNNYYINTLSKKYIANLLEKFFYLEKLDVKHGPSFPTLIDIMGPRSKTLQEMVFNSKYFYIDYVTYDLNKFKSCLNDKTLNIMEDVKKRLGLILDWCIETLSSVIQKCIVDHKVLFKELGMPLRVALTGQLSAPSVYIILFYLGKKRSLMRIDYFISELAFL